MDSQTAYEIAIQYRNLFFNTSITDFFTLSFGIDLLLLSGKEK